MAVRCCEGNIVSPAAPSSGRSDPHEKVVAPKKERARTVMAPRLHIRSPPSHSLGSTHLAFRYVGVTMGFRVREAETCGRPRETARGGWSEARSVGRPINGRNHTGGASLTRDGTLYFTLMDLESGRSELFRSRWVNGAFQEPERLPDEVNVGFQNADSYVAPDESFLVFPSWPRSGHVDNPGRLCIAYRDRDGGWSPARDLGPPFNTGEIPGSVTLSPDGAYVFFAAESPDRESGRDVYWVSARALLSPLELTPPSGLPPG